ncbi:hypothetical protein, partial [Cohnella fermenti]|uniref:hypothetical protein n=1 Tax=Cohnella fermenti TaxID=2565925 RepID=UPI001454D958
NRKAEMIGFGTEKLLELLIPLGAGAKTATAAEKAESAAVKAEGLIDDLPVVGKSGGTAVEGAGKGIINGGKVSVDAIKANPSALSGKSVDEIAQMLRNEGYDVTVQASTKSSSGAKIIKINNTGGDRNVTQVQVSPGGGRHGGSPYVKISTNDQGIVKVVDGTESAYKTDGKETATIIFTGGK